MIFITSKINPSYKYSSFSPSHGALTWRVRPAGFSKWCSRLPAKRAWGGLGKRSAFLSCNENYNLQSDGENSVSKIPFCKWYATTNYTWEYSPIQNLALAILKSSYAIKERLADVQKSRQRPSLERGARLGAELSSRVANVAKGSIRHCAWGCHASSFSPRFSRQWLHTPAPP